MSTVSTDIARRGFTLLGALSVLAAAPAWTQVPVDAQGNPIEAEVVDEAVDELDTPAGTRSAAELEELVGPIALYPDDLLAIVLPASAYPLQIVQAARFLEDLETNPDLKPDESWDDSVVALLNYPEVIEMMNEDLEWTYALGEAVVGQQADVIAAIEAFRDRAYAAGNLKSDDRQTVTRENDVIEIAPASEEVIYVPYYEPERVVVYQPAPVYYYYPRPYPVYYYPYPYGYSFAAGYFWGVTTAFHIGWLSDHLHVWHHSYWGHPYFGHNYFFGHWYRRPSIRVHNTYYVNDHVRRPPHHERDGDFWRPRRHSGALLDRRGSREAYYADRRERSGTDSRRVREQSGARDGRLRGDAVRDVRNAGERDANARFARNRAATVQRERTSGSERRPPAAAADRDDRDAIRFRPRDGAASVARQDGDTAIRFRPRERAALTGREDADAAIRFRPRERTAAESGRELSRPTGRSEPRRADPVVSERPSLRRDAEPARRVAPPSRSVERSPSGRPSDVPRVSRPSGSLSRAAPRASRPSSGTAHAAPRVSRPSGASRPAPSVSRPSTASSRSSSSERASRAAPSSRSGTRRPHNRD